MAEWARVSHSRAPLVLHRSDTAYPTRVLELGSDAPPEISVAGELGPGLVVGIVGTRNPTPEAEAFAAELAAGVVACRGVVISGGAVGIDAAAHRGALRARGRTWVVAPTGSEHVYPPLHEALYIDVVRSRGTLVWPFPAGEKASLLTFFRRNSVLAALADVLVVVQAGARSGALNAARWARQLNRPVWAVGSPPWDERFTGCRSLLDRGARPLTSVRSFLMAHELALAPGGLPATPPDDAPTLNWKQPATLSPAPRAPSGRTPVPRSSLAATLDVNATVVNQNRRPSARIAASPLQCTLVSASAHEPATPPARPLPPLAPTERALLDATAEAPRHLDEIAVRARVCTSAAATGLLTLALENVVVEGPEGFFRRAN